MALLAIFQLRNCLRQPSQERSSCHIAFSGFFQTAQHRMFVTEDADQIPLQVKRVHLVEHPREMEQDEEWATGRLYFRKDHYWEWKQSELTDISRGTEAQEDVAA